MSIKISFNNFKPFGENFQTITKKPITLIYGPNSTGKSSLIDALLYDNYLKLADQFEYGKEKYLNISNKYFAGDKLNLDNFESMVYKKDTSHVITLETIYNEDEKEFFEKIIGDYKYFIELLSDLDALKTAKENNTLHQLIANKLTKKEEESDSNMDDDKEDKEDALDKIIKNYHSLKNDLLGEIFSKNKKEISLDDELFCIEEYIQFMTNVANIKNIKIAQKVHKKGEKTSSLLDFYIDDSILFTYEVHRATQVYSIFHHSMIMPLVDIHNRLGIKIEFNQNNFFTVDRTIWKTINQIFGNKNIIEEFLADIVKQNFNPRYSYIIQYIGPLRLVPSKNDLFRREEKSIDYTWSLRKKQYDRQRMFMQGELETLLALRKKIQKIQIPDYPTNFLKSKIRFYKRFKGLYRLPKYALNMLHGLYVLFILLPISTIILVLLFVFMVSILIKFSIQLIFPLLWENAIMSAKHNFSNFFSKTTNLSNLGAVTSERMWSDFIGSEEMQKEIDLWLGKAKIKSHYKVKIDIVEPNWLQRLFKIGSKRRLSFIDTKTNTKVYPDEMGTGISQVLPILISAKMRKETTIFIEQPELHLHPALQAELADEFITSIRKQKNNFVMETHSEHLLLRFMKRMRQTYENKIEDENLKLTPDDISLLYVDTDGKNTFILELELDEDGTLLDPWPGGFFEEGFNERFL